MKKILFVVIILPQFLAAQQQITFQTKCGIPDGGKVNQVIETWDKGYALALNGSDWTNSDPDGCIIRTDKYGNTIWCSGIDRGGCNQMGYGVAEMKDHGYLMISSDPPAYGATQWMLYAKCDSNGFFLWDKRMYFTGHTVPFLIIPDSDGNFILSGQAQAFSSSYYSPYLTKINDKGDTLWTKCYDVIGGPGSVIKTLDGGLMMGVDNGGTLFIKIDSVGNIQWTKKYSIGVSGGGSKIVQNKLGQYLSVGTTHNGNNWNITLTKTDNAGNLIWTKCYGDTAIQQNGNAVLVNDSGYRILACRGDVIGGKFFVIGTDTSGNVQWSRTYGNNGENGQSFLSTSDGGFAMASGNSHPPLLIKTDVNGNSGCREQTVFTVAIDTFKTSINTMSIPVKAGGDFATATSTYWRLASSSTSYCLNMALPPVADFRASGYILCTSEFSPSCINFTNQTTNGISYQWIFEGASPSSDTAVNPSNICYTSSGKYQVTLIAYNPNGTDTTIKYVNVYDPLGFNISRGGDTLFAPQGYFGYQWYLNGTNINNAKYSYYVPTQSGSYSVSLIDTNGCKSYAYYNFTVGIQNISSAILRIYPNPSNGQITISFNRNIVDTKLDIVSTLGENVFSKLISAKENTISANLQPGIYYLRLFDGESQFTQKIIIQ